ncbi:MAG: hypothetical protein PUK59_02650 [Actinomycetaceae bacterium]|nr:hypothetical protein [Actinomycetaceae bacterium]
MSINSAEYNDDLLKRRFPCAHTRHQKKSNPKNADCSERIGKALTKPEIGFVLLVFIFTIFLWPIIPFLLENLFAIFTQSGEQVDPVRSIFTPPFTSLNFADLLTLSGTILTTVTIWYAVKETVTNTASRERRKTNKAKKEFIKISTPAIQVSDSSFSIDREKIDQKLLEEKSQKFTNRLKKLNANPAWLFQISIVCSASILLSRILPFGNGALTNGQKIVLVLIVFIHCTLFSFIAKDTDHIFGLNKKQGLDWKTQEAISYFRTLFASEQPSPKKDTRWHEIWINFWQGKGWWVIGTIAFVVEVTYIVCFGIHTPEREFTFYAGCFAIIFAFIAFLLVLLSFADAAPVAKWGEDKKWRGAKVCIGVLPVLLIIMSFLLVISAFNSADICAWARWLAIITALVSELALLRLFQGLAAIFSYRKCKRYLDRQEKYWVEQKKQAEK